MPTRAVSAAEREAWLRRDVRIEPHRHADWEPVCVPRQCSICRSARGSGPQSRCSVRALTRARPNAALLCTLLWTRINGALPLVTAMVYILAEAPATPPLACSGQGTRSGPPDVRNTSQLGWRAQPRSVKRVAYILCFLSQYHEPLDHRGWQQGPVGAVARRRWGQAVGVCASSEMGQWVAFYSSEIRTVQRASKFLMHVLGGAVMTTIMQHICNFCSYHACTRSTVAHFLHMYNQMLSDITTHTAGASTSYFMHGARQLIARGDTGRTTFLSHSTRMCVCWRMTGPCCVQNGTTSKQLTHPSRQPVCHQLHPTDRVPSGSKPAAICAGRLSFPGAVFIRGA
jgi:hypothetical protein